MQQHELNIRIDVLGQLVQCNERVDGVETIKNISVQDLTKAFVKSIDIEAVNSGMLPRNCIHFSQDNKIRIYVLYTPLQRVKYTYYNSEYENFPLPQMAFAFGITETGRVVERRQAVIGNEYPTPKTKVYTFPFSNVYASTQICIGAANELPVYKDPSKLYGLTNLIMRLPNGDHNYSKGNTKLSLGYRELLDHLKDKEPEYYYSDVLKQRKKYTLQDFIDNIIT